MLVKDIWRSLFMKCYKLLFILLLSYSSFADTYLVIPHDKGEAQIKLGDILYVEIINQDGDRPFSGEKVAGVFHVLDKIEKNTFRVIVSPQNPQNRKKNKNLDKFEMRGFNFEKGSNNITQEFLTSDIDYDLSQESLRKYIYIIIILFLLPFLFKLLIKYTRSLEEKKKLAIKRKRLKSLILKAKTREELENVYLYKKEIDKLLKVNKETLTQFTQDMNSIQYKQRWTEDDINKISKIVGEFKKDVSGI